VSIDKQHFSHIVQGTRLCGTQLAVPGLWGTLQEPGMGKELAEGPRVAFTPLFSVGSPVGELNSVTFARNCC